MPKKTKSGKNKKNKRNTDNITRTLVKKDNTGQQEYAHITKVLGGRRFNTDCFDGVSRIAIVRSKRMRIQDGDVVLVSLREFDKNMADIIWKYNTQEIKILQRDGEIPPNFSSHTNDNIENCGYEFEEENEFDFEDI